MSYNITEPYFYPEDVPEILDEFKNILEGHELMTMGKKVSLFESEFCKYLNSKYAIVSNSCTVGLEVVLKALGIGLGDEVIIPCQTFIATGSCVVRQNAKVVFCEVDDNFQIDFSDMKKKITNQTKAVIIVHFAGLISEDIFKIRDFLKEREVFLIEDCAHAHGAKVDSVFAGTIGDAGCFSFYATKIMSTGEGGMVVTQSAEIAVKCRSYLNRGLNYEASSESFISIGSNHRMTEFQAILGLYQLKRLQQSIAHRVKIVSVYTKTLRDLVDGGILRFLSVSERSEPSYWRFVIILTNAKLSRSEIKERLLEKNVRIDWPYAPLLHLQDVFRNIYGTTKGLLPKSEKLAELHICLPIHLQITEADAMIIANSLKQVLL